MWDIHCQVYVVHHTQQDVVFSSACRCGFVHGDACVLDYPLPNTENREAAEKVNVRP